MSDSRPPPDLPRYHPIQEVADHEVLFSFNGDSDALAFREWWAEEGLGLFAEWLEKNGGTV